MRTMEKTTRNGFMVEELQRTLLLLDYDGTLVNFCEDPEHAVPDERLYAILKNLSADERYRVVIITGRDREDIENRLGELDIELVAEHGACIKTNGEWKTYLEDDTKWKSVVLPVLIEYSLKCSHSFIEEKTTGYAWHYRKSNAKKSLRFVPDLIEDLQPFLRKFNLKTIHGNKVIEILPANISKGRAALMLLQEKDFDAVIAIGDDRTDEETFRALLPFSKCKTIKVGEGDTDAKAKLEDTISVLNYLESLC